MGRKDLESGKKRKVADCGFVCWLEEGGLVKGLGKSSGSL
jgi:hypothetical protein